MSTRMSSCKCLQGEPFIFSVNYWCPLMRSLYVNSINLVTHFVTTSCTKVCCHLHLSELFPLLSGLFPLPFSHLPRLCLRLVPRQDIICSTSRLIQCCQSNKSQARSMSSLTVWNSDDICQSVSLHSLSLYVIMVRYLLETSYGVNNDISNKSLMIVENEDHNQTSFNGAIKSVANAFKWLFCQWCYLYSFAFYCQWNDIT